MAIRFQKYVDITSGVGAASGVRRRDLIGRFFTTNLRLAPRTVLEADNADDIGRYFGTDSEEYARALFYFGWISKNITRAQKISFARWADTASAPMIFGATITVPLSQFKAVTAGELTMQLGTDINLVSKMSFEDVVSFADVASVVQTAIRAAGIGPLWEEAMVTFDTLKSGFNFTTTAMSADAKIAIVSGTINNMLGWDDRAIYADGSALETISDVLAASTDRSNNFGSFTFLRALSAAETEEAAKWNAAQNVMFQFHARVLPVDAAAYYESLKSYAGVGLTLVGASGEYPEQLPMMILAATDYSRRNSVQNYMFQQAALSPSVMTTPESNRLDALRVNYYGRTQTAGQVLDFYQRGVLMGGSTAPTDMNVYANEQWLKDATGSAIMELLISLAKITANVQGRGQLIATLQSVINQALENGTISVGKDLNNTQQLYVTNMTGDPDAWRQVQTIGYWLDCVIQSVVTPDGRTEYKAVYTLIYSKDDAIRKVQGSHVLI
jgi:hypothetical protein